MLFKWKMQVSRFIEDSGRTSLRLPAVRASDRNMILNLARFFSSTPQTFHHLLNTVQPAWFFKCHCSQLSYPPTIFNFWCISAYIASLGARKAHQFCYSRKQDKRLSQSLQFLASHQQGTCLPTNTCVCGYQINILSPSGSRSGQLRERKSTDIKRQRRTPPLSLVCNQNM